jgi:hypothetical protein
VGAGRAELTGRVHGTEREKGAHGATAQRLAAWAREAEGRGARRGKQLAPIGQPQRTESERESARERKLQLIGGSHMSGDVGARVRGLAGPSWVVFLFLFL